MRIEDALVSELPELLKEYFGTGRNCIIPEGSVVLFGSAAHLAERGLANYCEELVRVVREIGMLTGGRATVGHYIPVFRGETSNSGIIRDLLDLEAWLSTDRNVSRTLPDTRSALWKTILKMHTTVSNMESASRRYYLPESMHNGRRVIVESPGFAGKAPGKITQASRADEEAIIGCMINEVNEKLGLNLSMPDFNRSCATWQSGGNDSLKIYVCGGSHANRLAEKFVISGQQVANLARGGWQPTEQMVTEVHGNLKMHGIGKGNATEVIVMDLLANCVFCGSDSDGNLMPLTKQSDGKFHVHGNLTTYPIAKIRAKLNLWTKMVNDFGGCKYIFMLPPPRYISEPCCTDPLHCANFLDPDAHSELVGGLGQVAECIRRFANAQGVDYEIVDLLGPYANIESLIPMEADDGQPLWLKGDPIHFRSEVYSTAVDQVLQMIRNENADDGSAASFEAASKKLRLESVVVRMQGMQHAPIMHVKPSWSTGTLNPGRGGRGRGGTRGWRGSRGRGKWGNRGQTYGGRGCY